jgi:hypothetical protein
MITLTQTNNRINSTLGVLHGVICSVFSPLRTYTHLVIHVRDCYSLDIFHEFSNHPIDPCRQCKLPNLVGSCELTSRLLSKDEYDENSPHYSVGKALSTTQARVNARHKLKYCPYPPPMHVSTILQWRISLSCTSTGCGREISRYADTSSTLRENPIKMASSLMY